MKISVVIPAYNVGHAIGRTLDALLRQDIGSHEMEIIVVDDGSTDDTAEQVQRFPVTYIRQQNAGAAVARNTGFAAATGECVLFMDADCEPTSNALRCITDALETGSTGTIVGGIYAPARDVPLVEAAINEEIRYRHIRAPEEVRHIGSFCMGMQSDQMREIGDFDRRFERSEDMELSYRAVRLGASFIHRHPRTLWSWLKDQYRKARGRADNALNRSQVMADDGYVDHRDWASLLLAMLSAAALPFVWHPIGRWLVVGGVTVSMLLQVPLAAFAVRDTGDWRQIVLLPMQVLRGFAWVAGALVETVVMLGRRLVSPGGAGGVGVEPQARG
jgi:glycosyltransferase involved in cell wall biosynthesis